MIPCFVANGDITKSDLQALQRIRKAVALLPDGEGDKLTCHVVARLVARFAPGFRIVDGNVLHGYRHSWLQRGVVIIDPYPAAGSEPWIVFSGRNSPWRRIYREEPLEEHLLLETQNTVCYMRRTFGPARCTPV